MGEAKRRRERMGPLVEALLSFERWARRERPWTRPYLMRHSARQLRMMIGVEKAYLTRQAKKAAKNV